MLASITSTRLGDVKSTGLLGTVHMDQGATSCTTKKRIRYSPSHFRQSITRTCETKGEWQGSGRAVPGSSVESLTAPLLAAPHLLLSLSCQPRPFHWRFYTGLLLGLAGLQHTLERASFSGSTQGLRNMSKFED